VICDGCGGTAKNRVLDLSNPQPDGSIKPPAPPTLCRCGHVRIRHPRGQECLAPECGCVVFRRWVIQ
jgi:hypothetical protein